MLLFKNTNHTYYIEGNKLSRFEAAFKSRSLGRSEEFYILVCILLFIYLYTSITLTVIDY